jgi:ABC-type cobalamin/Fe3+-siderophores transport system ATPase subunit
MGEESVPLFVWESAIAALDAGQLPCSGGERRMLRLAASIAGGTPISLCDTLTGLDTSNIDLVTAAIRHAAGHPPPIDSFMID